MSGRRHSMALKESDVAMLLLAKTHLGKANINYQMEEYISTKRPDGIPVFDVKKIWEKILLAARIIVAVKNPQDVVAVSGNEHRQRAVLKFCKYTGATPIAGRFTPGTLTNQITSAFREPRLLIVSDPVTDHQPIAEASYVSIPTIAFCNTNASLKYIDVAIPGNTENDHSIGLMWWLLAREVQRMRGETKRSEEWDVMVDLFFYRDPEDVDRQEQEQQPTQEGEYVGSSWTDGMEGQQPPQQQQPPTQGQGWEDQGATPGPTGTAAPQTGENDWDEGQPIPTQQFMPTTKPAEVPGTENWGDDGWNN